MKLIKNVVLAALLASPLAAMSQTSGAPSGSPAGAATVRDADQVERNRPEGGSTAGANGRQDPTIKLSPNTPVDPKGGSGGKRTKPSQGGTTAGANGAQDPTIKHESVPVQSQTPK